MKKRLFSAALAFLILLACVPHTVFAVPQVYKVSFASSETPDCITVTTSEEFHPLTSDGKTYEEQYTGSNIPQRGYFFSGVEILLPEVGDENITIVLEKTGIIFAGWSDGVNVYAPGAKYTVSNADVEFKAVFQYTPHTHPVCGATHTDIGDHTGTCGDITWTAWDGTDMDTEKEGIQLIAGSYYLAESVELSSAVEIYGEVKLCLNGMVLEYYGYPNYDRVITVTEGAKLDISDCGTTEYKLYDDPYYQSPWILDEENGNVTLIGGIIIGGVVDQAGSNCIQMDNAVLNMYGGNIVGNYVYSDYGVALPAAAVVQVNDSTFNMYGGSIAGNQATRGSVNVQSSDSGSPGSFNLYNGTIRDNIGYGVNVGDGSSFSMSGGSISGHSYSRGAGVNIETGGSFNMSGGKITGNSATSSGSGVLVAGSFTMSGGSITGNTRSAGVSLIGNGTLSLSGSPVISGNTDKRSNPANLDLGNNFVITVGELKDGTDIGVTRGNDGVFTSGGAQYADSGYFTSDDSRYVIVKKDNDLRLAQEFTVSFVANNDTDETKDSVTVIDGSEYTLPECEFTPPEGFEFMGWFVQEKEMAYQAGEAITITADTTLRAIWNPQTLTGKVTVTGETTVDSILTATVTETNNTGELSYQWYRYAEEDTEIEGATGTTYTLTDDDIGFGIYCLVTSSVQSGSIRGNADGTVAELFDIRFILDSYMSGAPVKQGMSFTQTYPNVDPSKDLVPVKENHTFVGWFESTDGGETLKDTPYDFDSAVTGDVALYPVFKLNTYTVTYKADGKVVAEVEVEHGKDATAPEIPAKTGYTHVWDKDGKAITADTEINAVYTVIKFTGTENTEKVKDITPENVKPEDKTDLEKAKEDLEDALKDNYTEDEKEAIQKELDRIDEALDVIDRVEKVEELIANLPDTITKDDIDDVEAAKKAYDELSDYEKTLVDPELKEKLDAAIKVIDRVEKVEELIANLPDTITKDDTDDVEAAKKAYDELSDYEKTLIDPVVKAKLDDAVKAAEDVNKPADTNSPQTGDNTNLWLWIALLFVSGGAVITLTVYDRKRRTVNR